MCHVIKNCYCMHHSTCHPIIFMNILWVIDVYFKQERLIGRAGASPPSRTTGPRCLYIYIYVKHGNKNQILVTFHNL